MPAVSNSSPLIALAAIKRLDLLPALFQSVLIPPAVAHEIRRSVPLPLAWLEIRTLGASLPETVLRRSLANGEREAIGLALEVRPDAIILDDLPARRVAHAAGLNVVGTLGLADQLADALATYTQAGGTGEAVKRVQDEAVPAMLAAFEKLRSFFHGCDYDQALEADPQRVLPVYLRVIDHVFAQQDGWKRLRTLVKELSSAFVLAVPRPETEDVVERVAFFQRVAAMIRKRLTDESSGGGRTSTSTGRGRRGASGYRRCRERR